MRRLLLFLALLFFFCCVPNAHATTCGVTVQANLSGSANWGGYQYYGAPCTPGANSSLTDCQIYFAANAGGATYGCAVWDSDGGSGKAGTLLCQSSTLSISTSAGFNTFTGFGTCNLTSGHAYWVGFWCTVTGPGAPGLGSVSQTNEYQLSAPSNFTSYTGFDSFQLAAFLDVTASGGGGGGGGIGGAAGIGGKAGTG